MRILRVAISTWLVVMMTAVSIGQATDDPQEVVLAAFERLETYTFTSKLTNNSQYTDEAGTVIETVFVASMSGNIQANGDRQISLQQFTGETLLAALGSRAFILDLFRIDDELYINVGNIEYMEIIDSGWWRYDDLITQFESSMAGLVIDEAINTTVPGDYLPSEEYIRGITEQPNETIDGVMMRVFDIEIDSLAIMLDNLERTPEEKEAELAESAELVEAMEFSTVYRLWIGAEDGLLYRGTTNAYYLYPYLTAGGDDPAADFDLEATTTGEFEITSYGEVVEFVAPEVNTLP